LTTPVTGALHVRMMEVVVTVESVFTTTSIILSSSKIHSGELGTIWFQLSWAVL